MFEDEMLTIEDLARYLKLKPQTIYKWAQTGKIPGAKFGKEWRFRRSAIESWIDSRMAEYGTPGTGNHSGKLKGSANPEEDGTPPATRTRSRKALRGRKGGTGAESN